MPSRAISVAVYVPCFCVCMSDRYIVPTHPHSTAAVHTESLPLSRERREGRQLHTLQRAPHSEQHACTSASCNPRKSVFTPPAKMSVAQSASLPPAFIVLKGYHVGSKWFAEAFNRLPGGSFYFEYEHCLRQIGRQDGSNDTSAHIGRGAKLASPYAALSFLRNGCGCAESCTGCKALHEHRTLADVAAVGSPTAGLRLLLANAPRDARERRCLATGLSMGALGSAYTAHMQALGRLEPRMQIVAHVRSNHIKHALSFLRTTCDGELNHVTPTDLRKRGSSEGGGRGSIMRAAYDCPGSAGTGEGSGHLGALGGARRGDVSSVGADHGCQSGGVPHARKLWVPPPLLLLRASAAANEQTRIVQQAERVASELRDRHRGAGNSDAATGGHAASDSGSESGSAITYVVRYESMQLDLAGEMRRLLHALGVASHAAAAAVTEAYGARSDDASASSSLPSPSASSARKAEPPARDEDLLIKAGAENAAEALANYAQVESFLRSHGLTCLHSMLVAQGPVVFPVRACDNEVGERLSAEAKDPTLWRAMNAERDSRPQGRLKLNATECDLSL